MPRGLSSPTSHFLEAGLHLTFDPLPFLTEKILRITPGEVPTFACPC